MGIWFLIIIFGVWGITLIVRGWRGTPVPAGPRCVRCGYDLRGGADAGIMRCSECGNDLSRVVAGKEYGGPHMSFLLDSSSDQYFSREFDNFPADNRTTDVVLEPDHYLDGFPGFTVMWAKPMAFRNLPIQRRDLNFSLLEWRAKHPTTRPNATSQNSH